MEAEAEWENKGESDWFYYPVPYANGILIPRPLAHTGVHSPKGYNMGWDQDAQTLCFCGFIFGYNGIVSLLLLLFKAQNKGNKNDSSLH